MDGPRGRVGRTGLMCPRSPGEWEERDTGKRARGGKDLPEGKGEADD